MDFSLCGKIADCISSVIVGKKQPVEFLLAALLAEGHVLLEDVPGVGKTLLAKTLAKAIGGDFKRVQFTPDLLPADITGFNMYDQKAGVFKFLPGPVMANILLADEINRTVPRTQSSLLESMEEGQVTVDGETFFLPKPFFTIATQNPIEHEGTYPLPEAQLDRFLMRLNLGYPTRDEEALILERFRQSDPLKVLEPVVTTADIVALQQARRNIYVAEPVRNYILAICEATRSHSAVRFGASPRASMAFMRTAQGLAALRGREYVLPDDIKCLAASVLAHRLIMKTESSLRGNLPETIIADIISQIPVPVLET